jgi:DNA-binding GntR family transcriptional regulator
VTWDHGLRRTAIAEALLKDIVHGGLRPGQRLITRTLAKRFGVSHTPIREALIALEGIDIVHLSPNRGAVVRRVTTRDIRQISQVRRALECEATRGACGRIVPGILQRLHDDIVVLIRMESTSRHLITEEARAGVDSRLHDLIAESCDNPFLAREIGRLKLLFRAFREVTWAREEARHDVRRFTIEDHEHLAIVEALMAGDRLEAVRAMARHIRSASRRWSRDVPEAVAARRDRTNPRPNGEELETTQGR